MNTFLVTALVSPCCAALCAFIISEPRANLPHFQLELDMGRDYHKDAVEHCPLVFLPNNVLFL